MEAQEAVLALMLALEDEDIGVVDAASIADHRSTKFHRAAAQTGESHAEPFLGNGKKNRSRDDQKPERAFPG